jgi:hypothetical protein
MAFRVGQKVVCVDGNGYEPAVAIGEVYTIRWLGTLSDEFGNKCRGWTFRRAPMDTNSLRIKVIESACECQSAVTNRIISRDWPMLATCFRPVVDISDLQAIVREQMLGKPRHIAPDKFDRQRTHSAAHAPVSQHDASAHPSSASGKARSVFALSPDRAANCPPPLSSRDADSRGTPSSDARRAVAGSADDVSADIVECGNRCTSAPSPELAGSREQTASQAASRGKTPAAEV